MNDEYPPDTSIFPFLKEKRCKNTILDLVFFNQNIKICLKTEKYHKSKGKKLYVVY